MSGIRKEMTYSEENKLREIQDDLEARTKGLADLEERIRRLERKVNPFSDPNYRHPKTVIVKGYGVGHFGKKS